MLPLFKRDSAFNLTQASQILAPVVELRSARVGMVRHVLGGLQRPAIMQEHRDARAPKGVVAEFLAQPRCSAAGLDHIEHVAPRDGVAGQPVRLVECLE